MFDDGRRLEEFVAQQDGGRLCLCYVRHTRYVCYMCCVHYTRDARYTRYMMARQDSGRRCLRAVETTWDVAYVTRVPCVTSLCLRAVETTWDDDGVSGAEGRRILKHRHRLQPQLLKQQGVMGGTSGIRDMSEMKMNNTRPTRPMRHKRACHTWSNSASAER